MTPEPQTGSLQTVLRDVAYHPRQMSWWSPSWLPNLPSFDLSLPAGLQRHFLSYILNKFLGHFVKNGQLDARSIDSQIGSGYVQVKDIELDPTVHISPFQSRGFPFIHFRSGNQRAARRSSGRAAQQSCRAYHRTDPLAQPANVYARSIHTISTSYTGSP